MYIDYSYYKDTYKGNLESEALEKLIEDASFDIDRLTYGRIRKKGFEKLTEFQKELVRKAMCYQIDFIHTYGEYFNIPLTGFSVGDVSLSLENSNIRNGINASKKTLDYLLQSGLMSRRI